VPRKRSHKHARPDKENGRPDELTLSSGQPEPPTGCFTKKTEKRGKIAEKYCPNNFQNTHVYKADIPVQLAFQK
jgi:hypothetical protein